MARSLSKLTDIQTRYDFIKTAKVWKQAVYQAKVTENRRLVMLQEFYEHTYNDVHLAGQIYRQIESINSSKFKFTDSAGQEVKVGVWIYDLLREYHLARYFGYSIIEIQRNENAEIKLVNIPRSHIDPIKKVFYPNAYSTKSIKYSNMSNILEVNYHNILGDFEKITPLILMKYYTISAWTTYADRYSMPLRVIKTDTNIEGREEELHKALQGMSQMGSIVLNTNEILEFVQANDGNNNIFPQLVQYVDESISKIVSGSVTGEITTHGSKAREQVSNDINEKFNEATKFRVSHFINETVLPKLGLDLKFEFIIEQDKEKLFDKVTKLPNYDFDVDWLNETFGLKITQKSNATTGLHN